MRKSIVVAVSVLLLAAPAFAQHSSPANTISVFVSDVTLGYEASNGTRFDAGYGAAFDHRFTDRVSAELSVGSRRISHRVVTLGPAEEPVFASYANTLHPIDANVSYNFFTDHRWKPYLGAGMRYVTDSIVNVSQGGRYRITSRSINPEISGGVTFQFRPTLGLRFDAKQIVGGTSSVSGNSSLDASVGLSFRF